ncbi:MAG: hypothetical protein ACYTG0_23645 [Planctomycetota bacterium]|jgi:hypothetical protein
MPEAPTQRNNHLLTAVFLLYVVSLAIVAWCHEPWFDEAQAWLIARDSGLAELFSERLRYEGTPGLWHALLFVPAKLGLPFRTLSVISVVLASIAVYLFLRYSPFPRYVKVLFPFGFFTFYQYAVVARSYVLMALLMTGIAVIFEKRNQRPILFFSLLALLANVNAHGFIIAGCITLYHLIRLWEARSSVGRPLMRRHVAGAVVLGAIAILVVASVLPPDDVVLPGDAVNFHRLSLLPDAFTSHRALSLVVLGFAAVWFWRQGVFFLWVAPMIALSWLFATQWANVWHQGVVYYHWVFCAWVSLDGATTLSTSGDRFAAARKSPSGPAAGSLREGSPGAPLGRPSPSRSLAFAPMTMVVVLAFQVHWGIVCSSREVTHTYSASREVYSYLAEHRLDREVIYAHGFSTVSVLPYFRENVFDNHNDKRNPSYLVWAKGNPLLDFRTFVCDDAPEYILVGIKDDDDEGLNHPSYRLVRRFEGKLLWKTGVLEPDSYLLYRRRAAPPAELEAQRRPARASRVASGRA